jgi:hypothetical protein
MTYENLQSTRQILSYVAAREGQVTWFNVVTYVDRLDVERDPPPYAVLKELAAAGCLETAPEGGGNAATYRLTDKGRELLGRLTAAR